MNSGNITAAIIRGIRFISTLSSKPTSETCPPVFITGGTVDPLFGAALAFSKKLEKAGVNVRTKWYKGAVHSFNDFPTRQTDEALSDWTQALKQALK